MKPSNTDSELIMRSSLFRGVADSVVMRMMSSTECEMRIFKKGECIYSPTHFSRSIGIILEGSARVTRERDDGRKTILNTLGKGNIFGAAALFCGESTYISKIDALEICRVVFFSERLILRGIERDSRFAENYIRFLSDRILFLNRKIDSLTSGSAEKRLANFFADNLSEECYSPLPLSMTELACELNISRASLYRALDFLVDAGAISKQGKEYKINDINGLKTHNFD